MQNLKGMMCIHIYIGVIKIMIYKIHKNKIRIIQKIYKNKIRIIQKIYTIFNILKKIQYLNVKSLIILQLTTKSSFLINYY